MGTMQGRTVNTQVWSEISPINQGEVYPKPQWQNIAGSSNGQRLITCSYVRSDPSRPGRVYISNNFGKNWNEVRPTGVDEDRAWNKCVSDVTGQYLAVSDNGGDPDPDGGFIYTSDNYGSSWTKREPRGPGIKARWDKLTMSPDGSALLATGAWLSGTWHFRLWRSVNYGVDWNEARPAGDVDIVWHPVLIGVDPNLMFVGRKQEYLHKSIDGGATWNFFLQGGWHLCAEYWGDAAQDSDGSHIIIQGDSAGVFWENEGYHYPFVAVSTDSGATFSKRITGYDLYKYWKCCGMNGDGSYMLSSTNGAWGEKIYASHDQLTTYTFLPGPKTGTQYISMFMSSSGKYLYMVIRDFGIYKYAP